MSAAPPSQRCPLTVIGGFLGAGKTTLVNRLLATARGRYVVLVNDFGAVNIDADLVADHAGETLRLTNGCVCCSLNDDFVGTLIRLLDGGLPFDHVIIEASGVGDPGAIAEIALVEPQLVLNAVVVLADAERLPSLLADPRLGDTVVRQIRAADILLLNKLDLVDEAGGHRSFAALHDLEPGLRIVPTTGAEVPDDLLGLDRSGDRAASRFRAEPATHESTFRRVLYRRNGCLDRDRLADVLSTLPPAVLRLKGISRFDGVAEPMLLQMVGPRWSISAMLGRPASAWPVELVAIGTNDLPDEDAFGRLFDAALNRTSPPHGQERADAHSE